MLLRPLALLFALALLAPAAALAQAPAPQIDGSPLNVWTTPDGRVQVALDGAPGEFYPPGTADEPSTTNPNAGFMAAIDQGSGTTYYGGWYGSFGTPDSGPSTALGNPATVTTTWTARDGNGGPVARITQVLAYANGSRQVDATYTVQNISDGAFALRALWSADLAIRGSDSGVGFAFGNAPNRFIGGLNNDVGAAGGFVEQTPWTAFETNTLGSVSSGASTSFDNSVSTDLADNAAGVEWDDFNSPRALASGATATFRVGLRFVDTLGLSPLNPTLKTGDENKVTAKLSTLDGQPVTGTRLVWNALGSNEANGTATTNRNGVATFSYVGGNGGEDNLTVFADQNRNGQHDAGEPQASTVVSWDSGGLPAPIQGENVNVRPERGTVKVKLAKGTSATRAKALGFSPLASKRYVPLRAGLQIPVGSLIDTRRGTVRLMSAALPTPNGSSFFGASFHGSAFQVRQGRTNPLTQLIAKGRLPGCRTKVPKGGAPKLVAARKRSRTLFGSGKGRFRTRGRHSSATVRGTSWVQKDTCNSTITTVKVGTVIVRDFAKHRNVKVRAGHKYVARARKG